MDVSDFTGLHPMSRNDATECAAHGIGWIQFVVSTTPA
jgi:hypothetical protein